MLNSSPTVAPFFLTRNIANTMDALLRRLSEGSSVSLISGVRGVGKSRFLEQFYKTYDARLNIKLVRFENPESVTIQGAGDFSLDHSFLTELLGSLQNQSCLIIDQFEQASAETQRKILAFWNLHGVDKALKLVLSVEQGNLQKMTELFQGYSFSIDRVELTPLSFEEQLEYIRSTCCPKLRQHAKLGTENKKKLKATLGVFTNLEAFSSRYGHEIICIDTPFTAGLSSHRLLISTLGLLIITLLGVIGFSIIHTLDNEFSGFNMSSAQGVNQQETKQFTVTKNDFLQGQSPIIMPEMAAHKDANERVDMSDQAVPANTPMPQPESPDEEVASNEAVVAETADSLFEQRLRATENWLDDSDDNTASIQIMSLTYKHDSAQSITRYLEKLATSKVDLNQIKIFNFFRGETMLGVLYGSFENTAQARQSIEKLPEVLKANQPIPRTVRGIKDDIQRK